MWEATSVAQSAKVSTRLEQEEQKLSAIESLIGMPAPKNKFKFLPQVPEFKEEAKEVEKDQEEIDLEEQQEKL